MQGRPPSLPSPEPSNAGRTTSRDDPARPRPRVPAAIHGNRCGPWPPAPHNMQSTTGGREWLSRNRPRVDGSPVRLLKLGDVGWGARQFTIQRLAVGGASAQELGPRWDSNIAIDLLGKRFPQVRMMPTMVVTGAVAVLTCRCAQLHHLDDELLAGHRREVIIHHAVSIPPVDACQQHQRESGPMGTVLQRSSGGRDRQSRHEAGGRAAQPCQNRATRTCGHRSPPGPVRVSRLADDVLFCRESRPGSPGCCGAPSSAWLCRLVRAASASTQKPPAEVSQGARAAMAAYLRSGRSGNCCCMRCTSAKPASTSCLAKTSTGQR